MFLVSFSRRRAPMVQLLLREKVATAVTTAGPRKGYSSNALLGFYSSKADGMLYGMCPSEGCFFRWKMVRARALLHARRSLHR